MMGRISILVRRLALSVVAFCVACPASLAHAELQLDGRWRQGALREDFTVQQWLPNGCGPAPQTGTSGGGEIVAIRREGDELVIVGGGRVYRSNQCYDQMPTLSRETHSRDANAKAWRTRCTTPPSDPRKAILNTLVIASSDTHIDIVETGRYEVVVETGRCIADVKRTRTYDLVTEPAAPGTSTPAAEAADPAPTGPRTVACAAPGEPFRLEVRPSKKLLRTGEAFQFRAAVLDANGCRTPTPTTWKVARGAPAGVSVDANGNVRVGKEASEGVFDITVAAANKETLVSVEISSPARYDDLLAQSGLNASGETDAASVVSIASSIGAGAGRVEDRAKHRRAVFLAIVGGVLVVLAMVAAVVRRRSRRATASSVPRLRDTRQRSSRSSSGVANGRRRIPLRNAPTKRASPPPPPAAHQAPLRPPRRPSWSVLHAPVSFRARSRSAQTTARR